MSRIFIYDSDYDMILTIRHPLECDGYDVYANVVTDPKNQSTKIVTHPVDVLGLVVGLRPFPDVIIAETCRVDGGWLCGLVYDMELSTNCTVILIGDPETQKQKDKIQQLQNLYGVTFWSRPLNIARLVDHIHELSGVSC
ncbi:hypothetical protein K8R42_04345 [bacterium]|nr:hypothetical protein [bacterium]